MSPYQKFVRSLSDDEIVRIVEGTIGISCDAQDYCLDESGGVILDRREMTGTDREWVEENEPWVLEALFRQRALCRAEFDYQAVALLMVNGETRFCRHMGNRANMALMIDAWYLIAVGPDDVRSRYGYFCESNDDLDELAVEVRIKEWLRTGEAYSDYRAKTHCRYCQ